MKNVAIVQDKDVKHGYMTNNCSFIEAHFYVRITPEVSYFYNVSWHIAQNNTNFIIRLYRCSIAIIRNTKFRISQVSCISRNITVCMSDYITLRTACLAT